MLLCALFFLPGRSLHHKLFYGLFSIPALIALCLRPRELKELLREPIFVAVLLFVAWALLSLCWGPDDESIAGEFKPPLHTLLLFAGCYLLVRYRSEIIQPLLFCAAMVALIASIYNLFMFARIYEPGMRLIGGGAFDNPLLSSHLFGFFCTYWLSLSMTCKRQPDALAEHPGDGGHVRRSDCYRLQDTAGRTDNGRAVAELHLLESPLRCLAWRTVRQRVPPLPCCFREMIIERGDSYRFEIWQIGSAKNCRSPVDRTWLQRRPDPRPRHRLQPAGAP